MGARIDPLTSVAVGGTLVDDLGLEILGDGVGVTSRDTGYRNISTVHVDFTASTERRNPRKGEGTFVLTFRGHPRGEHHLGASEGAIFDVDDFSEGLIVRRVPEGAVTTSMRD